MKMGNVLATSIKKPEEIRNVLEQACARRELLILVTPFLRFESTFMALRDGELYALATMNREDAVFGLRTPELKIRFPSGLGFLEAAVEMKGLGLLDGKRTVRLSIPRLLRENDQRVAYRVERVGRVEATFSTPRRDLLLATLEDISTSGARLHADRDLGPEIMKPGDRIALTIPLSEEIHINGSGVVRHTRDRGFGVEFKPELPDELLETLSRWVFRRREEDRERLAQRLELDLRREQRPGASQPCSGILLVSSDSALESTLRDALQGTESLMRVPPAAQPLKEALLGKPALAIFHLDGFGLDERRRLRTLVEITQGRAPILLLGTGVDGTSLFELSSEWKASSAVAWGPQRGPFFQRLAQGIIRRHRAGGESPMAPSEERP